MSHRLHRLVLAAGLVVSMAWGHTGTAHAITTAPATIPTDFNLQVTPSPLVITAKPGTRTQVELKIRNGGSGAESLKIEPRSFTLSNDSTKVDLQDTSPPDIGSWVSFSAPKLTVQPGQWTSEQITFNLPKDTGFSYSFALVISRQKDAAPTGGSRVIKGSLAVFTLVNVDRPGATSNLSVSSFSVGKRMYEYLPATFQIRFRNSGNTITQPLGNIFVQRPGSGAALATLGVNDKHGYILPGTERVISTSWSDGFPYYKTVTNSNGSTGQKLVWDWGNLSKLRIGRYTAHLVAVYSQAGRDVPIEGSVSFWVIPWKILLGLTLVALLMLFSVFMIIRAIVKFIRKRIQRRKKPSEPTPPASPETQA
ncbi:MAG TPA: hypothetical protein VLF59_03710 [Candidatus Saccharimonadales bacterium]|nr:hypothetical protein [Candidatus Saccharimonadales bacterium]